MKNNFKMIALLIGLMVFFGIVLLALKGWKSWKSKRDAEIAKQTTLVVKPVEKKEVLPDLVEVTENYDTGQPKAKFFVNRIKPEVKHGEYKEFYPSGAVKIESNYKDGVADGPFSFYYEKGQKALEGAFLQGRRDGLFNEWHESGRKKLEYSYRNGALEGKWKEFYDDEKSSLMIEKAFAEGKFEGDKLQYAEGGTAK